MNTGGGGRGHRKAGGSTAWRYKKRKCLNNEIYLLFFIVNSPFYTVTSGSEAGVDLVLIHPFPLCYVNHIVLWRFVSKQGQPQPHIPSKARALSAYL